MEKRNQYFSEFGIHTITYTDEQLRDMKAVFEEISEILSRRKKVVSLSDELERLMAII